MALLTDNDMVVHRHAKQSARFHNAVGNLNVGAARLRVSARVIMRQNYRHRTDVQRTADDFTRVDRSLVD